MTDDQPRSSAQDELLWEPKVDDASIAVSAQDGVVTLRGTVGSFRVESADNGTVKLTGSVRSWAEHDAAVDAAWAAPGVKLVHDDLMVAY
jgi:osmotically-inducible protein OsmY